MGALVVGTRNGSVLAECDAVEAILVAEYGLDLITLNGRRNVLESFDEGKTRERWWRGNRARNFDWDRKNGTRSFRAWRWLATARRCRSTAREGFRGATPRMRGIRTSASGDKTCSKTRRAFAASALTKFGDYVAEEVAESASVVPIAVELVHVLPCLRKIPPGSP